MRPEESHDHLEVVNGPEDGTEFPLTRTPVDIGSDTRCNIHLRLDQKVQPFHARLTVVSDGYRIRSLDGAPVAVNGKNAGMVRSRSLQSGDILQVGETELALFCAPQGLASRSHGVPAESDTAWAARRTASFVRSGAKTVLGKPARILARAWWILFLFALVGIGVGVVLNIW